MVIAGKAKLARERNEHFFTILIAFFYLLSVENSNKVCVTISHFAKKIWMSEFYFLTEQ